MQLKYGLVVSFVAALTSLVSCNDQLDSRGLFSSLISTKIAVNVNFNDLKLQLSVSAELYLPGTDAFENVVSRWSNANTPSANVVVIPSNEADVQKIVSLFIFVSLRALSWGQHFNKVRHRSGSPTRTRCHSLQSVASMARSRH
jgi:hypothetical protein